jgi:hypothetical protein
MNRLMSPVMGALLLCAQSCCALAADALSPSATSNSHEQLRERLEAKREQLSGVARVSKSTQATQAAQAAVQDAPVVTDDAPSQEQQQ